MHLGLVGLGRMGANMRERLRRAGLEVTGYDRNPEVSDVGSSSFFRNEYYNMPQYRTFIATLRVRF